MESDITEKTLESKQQADDANEELRKLILHEQKERNQIAFENEKLRRDFETVKLKVKETMDVQDQQKVRE
jgi:hypothetical protein